jgi:aryl-alcohol dehydrogenase-like predicted oxidoreductase
MSASRLVLGTAALGIPYGLSGGAGATGGADAPTASAVLRRALALGIETFDTAPSYGEAEARVGAVVGERGRVWTKLSNLTVDASLTASALASVSASLSRLDRRCVELLQWHNWHAELASDRHFRACWDALSADPRVGALGASTYGTEDAHAAVRSGLFRTVQVEWNLLNQRVLEEIADTAVAAGVTIAVRSVFLQGVLTPKGTVPLNALALRAALGHRARPLVIVGPDREDQLLEIVEHAEMGGLDEATVRGLSGLDIGGDAVDPRTWRAPAN